MAWYEPSPGEKLAILEYGSGGGGGSFPDFTGSGSPEGVITADKGKTYGDTANGALWFKTADGGNTEWTCIGYNPSSGSGLSLLAAAGGYVNISDVAAQSGSYNGIYWKPNAGDGEQTVAIILGNGDKITNFNADGTTDFPGQVTIRGGYSTLYADGSAQFQGVTSTGDITVTYPHGALIQGTGTFGAVESLGDITVVNTGVGLVLQAPNASRYRLKVANDGTLSTELVV